MTPDVIAAMLTACFNMVSKIVDGQTPDQKAQIWQWFIDDQTKLRKFFHIGE